MNSQINKAILLLSCPDTLGVVARISHFIFERRGNIINLEQHVDTQDKMFFMRIEWDLKDFTIPFEDLNEAFSPLGKEFKANWTIQLINSFSKPKVALFISKYSSSVKPNQPLHLTTLLTNGVIPETLSSITTHLSQ